MEPEEALHWQILHRKKDGVEDWIDRSVEKIGAVPTLNKVLLPAMKEVGDKFGAGELILPFVLQSAEVMKRAVAQLENYLERIEGHTKGKVVIATVFGDVHDIGKSLVNTILTNNGYTVVDLGKQVPVDTIIDGRGRARGRRDRPLGPAGLDLASRCRSASQELHQRGLEFPVLIGGAAINRDFGRRILYPGGKESDEVYEPGVFYCKDAFEGLDTMDALIDAERARRAGRADPRRGQGRCARRARAVDDAPPTTDDTVRSACAHRRPDPRAARSGARARSRSTSTTSSPTSTATCSSSSTGAGAARRARSGAGSSRATTARRASRRASSACGASRTTSTREPGSATSPAPPTATSWSSSTPRTPSASSSACVFPRQPKHDRICLTDFYRPLDDCRASATWSRSRA